MNYGTEHGPFFEILEVYIVGGGGFGRQWVVAVVGLVVADGSKGACGGIGRVAVGDAVAACGGPSQGHGSLLRRISVWCEGV